MEVLQWSKLDGFWGTQNETKTTPNCTFALHLLTATAPHKQLQPANLRDAPDGVYEGVGCARQQSEAARNDSRGVFANSKLRPSSTQNSQNRKTIPFHAREPSAMATSPMKKRLSPKVCCSPGGCFGFDLFFGTYRVRRCVLYITPHWGGFPSSIARQPKGCQHRAKRLRKAL